jgi:hypothetical protein
MLIMKEVGSYKIGANCAAVEKEKAMQVYSKIQDLLT